MENGLDLFLDQSQKMLMTPQMRLALEVLKMNNLELMECIQNQMEMNPMLEVIEVERSAGDSSQFSDSFEEEQEEDNDETYKTSYQERTMTGKADLFSFAPDKSMTQPSLQEYLLLQLHTAGLNSEQVAIGQYIIDNIDDNGYLRVSIWDVAENLNVYLDDVDDVIKRIQAFDPPGVCSSDLKECLLSQLKLAGCGDPGVFDLVEHYLDDLGANKIASIAKKTGMTVNEVVQKSEIIKSLEPKPGRGFCSSGWTKYIFPDVLVIKKGGGLDVQLIEEQLPPLGVSEANRQMVAEGLKEFKEYSFYQNEIKDAEWFIKCLEQRKNTLTRVVQCIVKKQAAFFETEHDSLKPLTLKEVAQELELHESTVSRAVSDKHLQCNKGLFELKRFFSGRLNQESGSELSSRDVKDALKKMIDSEEKASPLTDGQIAELLTKQGTSISRRTVAKYRSEQNIPAVERRRRY